MLGFSIKQLAIYPIKSCAGIELEEAELTSSGFKHDREFMLVDEKGRFLSQRQYPQMATIKTQLKKGILSVSKTGLSDLIIPALRKLEKIKVSVWDDEFTATKYPSMYGSWFEKALGTKCHLVKMPRGERLANKKYTYNKSVPITFVDGYPIHIINSASVKWVTKHSGEVVPADRYRANIVYTGKYAFEEDHIGRIKIGDSILELVKTTYRCAITQTNQQTGERLKQPLIFLSNSVSTRRTWNGAAFGQYAIVINPGKISKNARVEVLKQK